MNLKLLEAVAIFATAPIVAFAQNDDPADQAPKPTLADAQNVVQTISSDKTKLQAYCKLGKLPDQMQKAEDRNDTKAVDALVAKADPLAQQIGPECPGGSCPRRVRSNDDPCDRTATRGSVEVMSRGEVIGCARWASAFAGKHQQQDSAPAVLLVFARARSNHTAPLLLHPHKSANV